VPEVKEEFDQLIGRTISGRYRVKRLLGQGGMGKVYQAKQIALGRDVALKVLGAKYVGNADPEFHKRFFHEAAIMAKLKCPNTVTVFEYGCDQDVYFIAMELVSGKPLDRELRKGPMAIDRILTIVVQVCRSLREAHSKGIVHRDLKPANVILTMGDDGEETVKLLDFGLAKRLTTVEETNPNLVPGSPKYMSPELIRQQPVDGRADIYALGVMLYQMLTGVVPFDREDPLDILRAHLNEQPPAMNLVNPNVRIPPRMDKLVMRCLAKDPALRYRNVPEVLGELRTIAQELGLADGSSSANIKPLSPDIIASIRPMAQQSTPMVQPSTPMAQPRAPMAQPPTPGLHMALDDEIPEAKRPEVDWNLTRVFPVAIALVLSIIAGAYFIFGNPAVEGKGANVEKQKGVEGLNVPNPNNAAASTPPSNPAASTPPSRPAPSAENTADKKPATVLEPKIRVDVSSNPAGATVFVGQKPMGQTPTTFEWSGGQAARGNILELRLDKTGYQPQVVKKSIDKDVIALSVTLSPTGDKPTDNKTATKTAPRKKKEPAVQKGASDQPEFEEALQNLEERERTTHFTNEKPTEGSGTPEER
jgi:eukaryotic-like serine/threonine-protein kinase